MTGMSRQPDGQGSGGDIILWNLISNAWQGLWRFFGSQPFVETFDDSLIFVQISPRICDFCVQVISGGRTSSDSFASYRTPLHADFLLAHSTVAGYYRWVRWAKNWNEFLLSWRNTASGSWFIQVNQYEGQYQYCVILSCFFTTMPCVEETSIRFTQI